MMKKGRFGFSQAKSVANRAIVVSGQMAAISGTHLFDILLIWHALKETSYVAASAVIFLQFVPYALFGLACGWLSDRFNRRYLIAGADLFRALICGAAMAALWLGAPLLPVLAVGAFFMTAARTVFQPALKGIIPEITEENQVVKLNSILHGGYELAGIVVLAIAFAMGCAGAAADILFATIVQCAVPNAKVSRTFATFSTLANSSEALSAPGLAVATGLLGIGGALMTGACLPVCASMTCLALAGRTKRSAHRL